MITNVAGIIPAAGLAKRLPLLSVSKEIFPISIEKDPHKCGPKLCTPIDLLLDKMCFANVKQIFVIIRRGKWDIPNYLNNSSPAGRNIAYLMMGNPYGALFSTNQAYPFTASKTIAFGFPDILFNERDAFQKLLAHTATSNADIALGLFPCNRPDKVDMVDVDGDSIVRRIDIKPQKSNLTFAWGLAVWKPVFSEFIDSYAHHLEHEYSVNPQKLNLRNIDVHLGYAIKKAIDEGIVAHGVKISDKPFLDIGTPDDLVRAVRVYGSKATEQTPPASNV